MTGPQGWPLLYHMPMALLVPSGFPGRCGFSLCLVGYVHSFALKALSTCCNVPLGSCLMTQLSLSPSPLIILFFHAWDPNPLIHSGPRAQKEGRSVQPAGLLTWAALWFMALPWYWMGQHVCVNMRGQDHCSAQLFPFLSGLLGNAELESPIQISNP